MCRFRWYHLALMLLLVPHTSFALDLYWINGAMDLTFTEATRCTLVVSTSLGEQTLPPEWRLIWVADSCEIRPLPQPCGTNVAQIAACLDTPGWAQRLAGSSTVQFCSSGESAAAAAWYVFDAPAIGSGKLRVIALDPADPESARVLQSPNATFNGGSERSFPPSLLRTSVTHQSTAYELEVVGTGLDATSGVRLVAHDGSWDFPLEISGQADTLLTASASIAAHVPTTFLWIDTADGTMSAATLPADSPPPALALSCPAEGDETKMREVYEDHAADLIQPKDFALVPGGWTPEGQWLFHIFYIRKNQYLASASTEKNLGHAVSNGDPEDYSLSAWSIIDTAAIRTRGGRWDSLHVWAPSIVRKGLTYDMFYTGVGGDGHQRIGYATSSDLMTWVQRDSVVEVTPSNTTQIPWADPAPAYFGGKSQLRDPFVTDDPDTPGKWLMYFVTVPSAFAPEMVVGVARSEGDLTVWEDTFPLLNTHRSWPNPYDETPYRVESPHAFFWDGEWWLFSTINGDSIWAESNAFSPVDEQAGRWSQPQKLTSLVPPLQSGNLFFWHASEHLKLRDGIEYLAGWNDANVCISITQIIPNSSYLFSQCEPSVLEVDEQPLADPSSRLWLAGLHPGHSQVTLRMRLPVRMRARVDLHDIAGRRVRTLASGELASGERDLIWDGRDENGCRVGSGVYFASLLADGKRYTVRVPFIR
jgi:hypothetical protein